MLTFTTVWPVSLVIINSSASLDNAAKRETVTLISDAPNNKTLYRNGTMLSFQASAVSACGILIAVYVSGGFKETSRHLLAFDISIGALYLM